MACRTHPPQRRHHRDPDVPREIGGLIEARAAGAAMDGAAPGSRRPHRRAGPRRGARIRAPSGRASERRPSYFSAWTMARSAPSYAPIARARSTRRGARRQRGHRASGTLIARQVGSGSPQRSHSGGVSGRIDCQHRSHTGPCVGCSSSSSQAAQAGASTTLTGGQSARMAVQMRHVGRSRQCRVDRRSNHSAGFWQFADVCDLASHTTSRGDLDPLRVAPQPLEAVEQPRLGREDVHDEVEVVEQDPFGPVVAFDVRRLDALVRERLDHAVGNRANLPRVACPSRSRRSR